MAVNAGTLPVPFAAKPMLGSELVQSKVPPAGLLTKLDAVVVPPLQIMLFAGTLVVGVGFTVTVDTAVPVQPPLTPVTV